MEESVPCVRAQAEMLKDGRWEQIVVTDAQWKGRNSGYSTIGTWQPHRFGGEFVDASMLLPDLTGIYRQTAWQPVFTAKMPWLEATMQLTEPNKIFGSISAVSVKKLTTQHGLQIWEKQ